MRDVRAALIGAVAWTAAEYGLHRFVMHEKRGPAIASREHLMHHADVTYFSPASKKLLTAAAATALAFPAASAATGRRAATAFTVGMVGTYFAYEVAHRRVHTHPPATAYGRWMRRNHLAHHFAGPTRNHGVTSPVWDRAFGTAAVPEVVVVPRRMAPAWLLDEHGEVHPEHAGHYEVRGRSGATTADVERDRVDAFANRSPVADPDPDPDPAAPPGGDQAALAAT